ncbi:MAG: hypothetical protein CMM01_05195 [Rhodopirellula sp.]|nr:hypothetical protein [Rhodopirellula sp.]
MQIRFRELLGSRSFDRAQRKRRARRRAQLEFLEQRITMTASSGMEASSGFTSGFHAAASDSNDASDMRADIPDQVFAPYVDTTLWPPFNFVELAKDEGVKYVTLAFVVADPATSEPSWGGYYSVDSGYRGDQIDALRELGGEVLVSFGGAAGTPLAAAITDVDDLTQAYQAVVDQYALTWIDFDVEGSWVADEVSIDRRSQAIRNLQDQATVDGRPLEVWFTLPVLPSGLTNDGLYVVESALSYGVDIGGVNIMAMDYGDSAAPNPEGQMGDYAIEAAESLFDQMRGAYDAAGVQVTDAELWSLVGVTPMIGQNDVMSERFYLEDAEKLLDFADEVGMGFLSAWSANRDAPCETFGTLALTCSGVPQEPFEFAQTLGQFTIGSGDDGSGDDGGGDDGGGDNPTGDNNDSGLGDLTGNVFPVNPAAADIMNFNPDEDRLDFGDISVHNLILGKLESGEVAIVNPWAWTPEYQVVKDRSFTDLSIHNYGVVANEHLRQDIGGVVSWEQGVGPREADTVYVRSHEYGVQERIDDFDPETTKLSFLYFGTRERLSVEETSEGLLISVQPTNQSVLLSGVLKSDLVPANIEFHHDQIVEDQLELHFGFSVDELTLVSRSELLTPAAPPGETTDGNQTRPGSGNSHDHGNHDHGGDMDGMMPSLSVVDVVVNEGTIGNVSSGALSTLGNQIVDEAGESVRLAGVNWFGFETTNFAPHGLWSRGYVGMMEQMKAEGFNTIRLPYSDELFDAESIPNGIDFSKNPDLEGLNGLEIMDRIVAQADELGLRVILDHHRSAAGNSANESGLWYSAEYPESVWIDHLTRLATRYANNSSVVGIDLHNEPHGGATWGDGSANDWRLAAERAGNAVLAANPDLLIIVEGVEAASSGYYWWGGNLSNAGDAPVRLEVENRLVYSAHDYPASVYQQDYFSDPAYPDNLTEIWNENWGYLFRDGIAPVLLGEFGSKLETVSDQQWFDTMVEYLKGDLDGDGDNDLESGQEGISWTYWSWNPNSGDTGGILKDDWQTIHENKVDGLETVQSDFSDASGDSSTVAVVTVNLSAASMQTVTVEYSTVDGTAVAESDYTVSSGTLTFLPGEVTKTIQIHVNPDANVEPDELFFVNLTNATHASLADANAMITIVDDDNTEPSFPSLSVSDASVTEGDTGTKSMSFTVLLSDVASEDVTFDYATTSGSAVAPGDYTDVTGTLTIPAGQIDQTITVDVNGDLLEEGRESFQVNLSNAVNATLADANAEGTIVDNDQTVVPAGFSYRTTDDWGTGFNGEITLTNRGDEAWAGWRLEFDWTHEISQVWNALLIENSDGSFVIDNEFWNGTVGPGQSVVIGLGGSPGNVTTIPFNVYVNGTLADVGQSVPMLSVADTSLDEGESDVSVADVVVSLSTVASEDVTVNYTTMDGTAVAGSDYQSKMGSVTIPAGSLSAVISLSVKGDLDVETDETLTVELSSPQGAVIADGSASVIIKNDDLGSSNNSAEYRTVNDWGSGFTGELKLTNRTDEAWDGWEIEFDWEHNLTQFWSSKLVSHSGQHYVVKNESWNGTVEPGGSVTLGFSGNPGNVVTSPRNITINGQGAGGNDESGNDAIEMTVGDVSMVEPDAGTETLAFTVKLSKAVPEGGFTSVEYSTVAVTAEADQDFVPTQGTLEFLAGEMEKTIEVLVKGDAAVEADETFELALSQVVNATLADDTAVATIQNNDSEQSSGDVAWNVSSQWGTGYVASIVITNNGEQSWNAWELEFDSPHQIDSIWGAQIVSHEGTRYRLRALSWNGSVASSGSVSIGYQVNTSGPLEPTNFKLKTT